MWARLESNTIVEILTRPKALNIGDVKYPRNIFSMWTDAELAVIGIVPVTIDNTNFKNQEYYINNLDEVENLINGFAINADKYDYKTHIESEITPADSPMPVEKATNLEIVT